VGEWDDLDIMEKRKETVDIMILYNIINVRNFKIYTLTTYCIIFKTNFTGNLYLIFSILL